MTSGFREEGEASRLSKYRAPWSVVVNLSTIGKLQPHPIQRTMIQVKDDARLGSIGISIERQAIGSASQSTSNQPVDVETDTGVQVCSLARLGHYV
jgi:hypothetical protein